MLCLMVKTPAEKSVIKCSNRVYYDLYTTRWGEICIFRIQDRKNSPAKENKLRQRVGFRIHTANEPVPQKYLQTLSVNILEQKLRQNRNKTVCIDCPHITKEQLYNICLYSKAVYFVGKQLPEFSYEIYKATGVMPILRSAQAEADFYNVLPPDFKTVLPEGLDAICPEEFTKTLFAGLLYLENGVTAEEFKSQGV